ncbi:MAG: hypothetical protein LBV74_01105 [Tannerella sp.]|jgi:hypothetical protein|nr:hypothetical protein [Tannerella sp.]
MILENIEKFTDFVPTAAGSDIRELQPFITEAEQWFQDEWFGADLYNYISGLPDDNNLKTYATISICLRAYEQAIPFLDVIQTANGFAVVSNSNQAPASKERVERLIVYVVRRLSEALDRVVLLVMSAPESLTEWKKSDIFLLRSSIVFLRTSELRNHSSNTVATYHDLDACRPLVSKHQITLSKYISESYLSELLNKFAENVLTNFDKSVFTTIQMIIGLMLQQKEYYPFVESLLNRLASHPDECLTYIASDAYRIKTGAKYENKKDDKTYFFG